MTRRYTRDDKDNIIKDYDRVTRRARNRFEEVSTDDRKRERVKERERERDVSLSVI